MNLSIALSESAIFWSMALIAGLFCAEQVQNTTIEKYWKKRKRTKRTKEKENQLLKFVVQKIVCLLPPLIRKPLPLA